MSQSSTATLPNVIPQHRITLTFPNRRDASGPFFSCQGTEAGREVESGKEDFHCTKQHSWPIKPWSELQHPPPAPLLSPANPRVFEMNRINYQSAIWFVISPSAAHVWTQTFIQTLGEKVVVPSVSTSHKHNTAARTGFHLYGGPELETVQSGVCIKHANCQYIKTVDVASPTTRWRIAILFGLRFFLLI